MTPSNSQNCSSTENYLEAPEEFTIHNPGGLDLSFKGNQLIALDAHDLGNVRIYRTVGGRIVLRQRRSSRPGFIETDRLEICDTLEHALAYLVPGTGLNAIRQQLGLPSSIRLE